MNGDRGDSQGASVNTQLKEAKYANMENFNCTLSSDLSSLSSPRI